MKRTYLQQLEDYIYRYHINRAYLYDKSLIKAVGKINLDKEDKYDFLIKNLDDNLKNVVKIGISKDNISSVYCSCSDFQKYNSCEHIAAIIINYNNFNDNNTDIIKEKSHKILTLFSKNNSLNIVKKKLNIEYTFILNKTYWGKHWNLKIKLGLDKLYAIGSKYNKFINAYYDKEGQVEFGKYFVYDPKVYYFDDVDNKILDFLYDNCDFHYGMININDKDFPRLFKFFENKDFYIENIGLINGIKEQMPLDISLNRENDDYILDVNITKDFIPLTNNLEFILWNKQVYYLKQDYRKLLTILIEDEIQTLIFNKQDLQIFSEGILPIIKNEVKINEDIQEINDLSKPDVKLYFDINKNDISCKIKLNYKKEEIDYFAKDKELLRDIPYEKEVIKDLNKFGFEITKEKIFLNNLDRIVYFLEAGLDELSTKYQVFTSEKLKGTNIKKKLVIYSNFTIGKDNILHYDFDLQDIDSNELGNLLSSLEQKKKYYKLKNGDIVSLEDKSLNELREIIDDLSLDIKASSGVIPKYRAIYLDSLKKEKYPNIKTSNSFNDFIAKFNKYKDNNLNFTQEESKVLRTYQLKGVEWLYNIHKCDLGGILADEMGLGKSIQTIYFFKKLLEENRNAKFMIVCPTALIYNWANEFKKFAKNIKIQLITGTKNKRISFINRSQATVFITSYGTLREDIDLYTDKKFTAFIIDEAQNIKNPLAKNTKVVKKVKAETKIALTGTPLENSVTEIWSIFDFIMPGFLESLTKFNKRYKFKEMDDEALNAINRLNKLISPFILRRKKTEVAKDLPLKIENNIYIDLEEDQKKLYAQEIKKITEEIDNVLENSSFNNSKFQILQLLTRLRQLCIDPRLIYENYKGKSAKIETLIKVIKEVISNNHKVLLFTSFKSALEIIREELRKSKISYFTIDGSVDAKNRQMLVDKFNKDATNVFLITLKSGGTGLNLTSADVVIHLDLWWNPQAENQATDRAHRIGQTKIVEVIKLISSGTIEERILELQKKKQTLSEKIIENRTNIELANLTEQDIRDLLRYDNFN